VNDVEHHERCDEAVDLARVEPSVDEGHVNSDGQGSRRRIGRERRGHGRESQEDDEGDGDERAADRHLDTSG
jgi:hypothetical protein